MTTGLTCPLCKVASPNIVYSNLSIPGTCYNDGLYYMDETNFVICSNGNAYIQPCAPGTRSSGQHRYSPGYYYGYSDFCDINLVDMGYGPAHYAPYGISAYNNLNAPGYGYGYDESSHEGYGANSRYGSDRNSASKVERNSLGYLPEARGYRKPR